MAGRTAGRRPAGGSGRSHANISADGVVPPSSQALPAPPPIRGRQRLALVRDLAIGEWSDGSLASMYGLSSFEVMAFRHQNEQDIAEVAAALAGTLDITTAGIWLTKKQQRLAEYQQAIEDIDSELDELREAGIFWSRAHRDMFRARLDLYRQAADELGAYPQRTAAPSRQDRGVHYVIDSDAAEDMK